MRTELPRHGRLVVGVVALVLVALTALVTATPVVAVRTVTVSGADATLNRNAQAALESMVGKPLARVDTQEVRRAALAVSPSIVEADVRRVLPSTLEVRLVRREPVLRWVDRSTGTTSLVDAGGTVFGRGVPAPKGTPVLAVSEDLSATERAAAVKDAAKTFAALPDDLRSRVKGMRVETRDDIRFALRGDRDVRWGSVDDADVKATVLMRLLKAVPAAVYDVSAPDLPTTRGQR